MKKRYFLLIGLLFVFIALSVWQYQRLRSQQRRETAEFIKKEIVLCGEAVERIIIDFEESVKYEFSNRELDYFFDPSLQELNFELYNKYISNDIKKIRQFYSSNQIMISNISIYNQTTYRVFQRNNNNYFSVTVPKRLKVKAKLLDQPAFIEENHHFYYIQPIRNAKGILIANARFGLNMTEFFVSQFNRFYIAKDYWSWVIYKNKMLLNKHSIPGKDEKFETDILPILNEKLEANLSATIDHTVKASKDINVFSVFYPVNILGERFGIAFSVNTDTLYQNQNKSSIQFFFFVLIVIIGIVFLFIIIIRQMRIVQQRLETTEGILRKANKASEVLLTDPDFDNSMKNFLEITGRSLGYHRAFILKLNRDEKTREIQIIHRWNDSSIVRPALELMPELSKGINISTILEYFPQLTDNKIVKFNRNEANVFMKLLMTTLKGKAFVGIPILIDNDIFGMIGFMDCLSERDWPESEDVFFLNLANAIGGALSSQNKKSELIQAKDEAEKANNSKSEFLSRMSHELRTPLNAILGFSQLLEMGELNHGQRKGVNHILNSGRHLLNLINEVLDISRIESGNLAINLESVCLNELIIEIIEISAPLAKEQNITMEFNPDNLYFVKSDKQRLKQILINLVNNALKYNVLNGKVIIDILYIEQKKSDPMIRTMISDTGIGISDENISRLFNPFERVGADKTGVEGTGLGLSVVKKLVEAMDGTVNVKSSKGKGTTFWFDLPVSDTNGMDASKLKNSSHDSLPPVKSGTILYIEDNPSNLELLEQILLIHRPDVKLISSKTGGETLKMVADYHPNLILLDLDLPDVYGGEVLKKLKSKEATKEIPVVIVSADAMPAQVAKMMHEGASDYLTKPIDVISLLNIIQKLI